MKRGTERKFGREKAQRAALLKALATALFEHGKIRTTRARAKTLAAHADRLIRYAKKQDIPARRLLLTKLGSKITAKLVNELAGKFTGRSGGYVRTVALGRRRSDGAEIALVELLTD